MSHADPGPLSTYNSLQDKNLVGFFNNSRMRRHLRKSGLINRRGEIVTEASYRLTMARKEHQKHVRDLMAQAIVHKALDMERHRQASIKRKLEEIAKVKLVQRVRSERARKGDEDITPFLSPRAPQGRPHSAHSNHRRHRLGANQRPLTAPTNKSSSSSSSDKQVVYVDEDGFPIHREKRRSDTTEEIDSHNLRELDPKIMNSVSLHMRPEDREGLAPYRVNQSFEPHPPTAHVRPKRSRPKPPKSKIVVNKDGKKLKPKSHKGSLALHRKEPAFPHANQLQTLCDVMVRYRGNSLKIQYEREDLRDEIMIYQQHCGGENLLVFEGMAEPGTDLVFTSRRHRGYPFSVTFFVNRVQSLRLSACCEYKYTPHSLLGGAKGHFKFIRVDGAAPCYRCMVEAELARRERQRYRGTQTDQPVPPPEPEPEMTVIATQTEENGEEEESKDADEYEDDFVEDEENVKDEEEARKSDGNADEDALSQSKEQATGTSDHFFSESEKSVTNEEGRCSDSEFEEESDGEKKSNVTKETSTTIRDLDEAKNESEGEANPAEGYILQTKSPEKESDDEVESVKSEETKDEEAGMESQREEEAIEKDGKNDEVVSVKSEENSKSGDAENTEEEQKVEPTSAVEERAEEPDSEFEIKQASSDEEEEITSLRSKSRASVSNSEDDYRPLSRTSSSSSSDSEDEKKKEERGESSKEEGRNQKVVGELAEATDDGDGDGKDTEEGKLDNRASGEIEVVDENDGSEGDALSETVGDPVQDEDERLAEEDLKSHDKEMENREGESKREEIKEKLEIIHREEEIDGDEQVSSLSGEEEKVLEAIGAETEKEEVQQEDFKADEKQASSSSDEEDAMTAATESEAVKDESVKGDDERTMQKQPRTDEDGEEKSDRSETDGQETGDADKEMEAAVNSRREETYQGEHEDDSENTQTGGVEQQEKVSQVDKDNTSPEMGLNMEKEEENVSIKEGDKEEILSGLEERSHQALPVVIVSNNLEGKSDKDDANELLEEKDKHDEDVDVNEDNVGGDDAEEGTTSNMEKSDDGDSEDGRKADAAAAKVVSPEEDVGRSSEMTGTWSPQAGGDADFAKVQEETSQEARDEGKEEDEEKKENRDEKDGEEKEEAKSEQSGEESTTEDKGERKAESSGEEEAVSSSSDEDETRSAVTVLNLNEKGITSDRAVKLANSLLKPRYSQVQYLLVRSNPIGDKGLTAIVQSLIKLQGRESSDDGVSGLALTHLDLGDTQISNRGINELAELLKLPSGLENLNLSDNVASKLGWLALAAGVRENNSLKTLSVEYMKLGDEGCREICEAVADSKTIKELNLEGNDIGDEGGEAILKMLRENERIETVNFERDNSIPSHIAQEIKDML